MKQCDEPATSARCSARAKIKSSPGATRSAPVATILADRW